MMLQHILRKRKEYLLKESGLTEIDIKKLPVVSTESNFKKPMDKRAINNYCRDTLRKLRIITDKSYIENDKGNGGQGVSLLKSNYTYKINHECGLEGNDGIVEYLHGKRIRSVTSDSYTSYSCPEGQKHLYNYLRRDSRVYPKDDINLSPCIKQVQSKANETTLEITNPRAGKLISVEIKIECDSDVLIEYYSERGVTGSIEIR